MNDERTYQVTFKTGDLYGKLAVEDLEDVIRHALQQQGITVVRESLSAAIFNPVIALCDICEQPLTVADTEKCSHCNTVWAKAEQKLFDVIKPSLPDTPTDIEITSLREQLRQARADYWRVSEQLNQRTT